MAKNVKQMAALKAEQNPIIFRFEADSKVMGDISKHATSRGYRRGESDFNLWRKSTA